MTGPSDALVLDTSIVIASDVAPLAGSLAVSAITMAELHFGVIVAKSTAQRAERLRRLSFLQRRFHPLPVDDAVATSYGMLAGSVVASGHQPRRRSLDLLIAATAHAHRAKLCTRNPDDFAGLEEFVEIVTA